MDLGLEGKVALVVAGSRGLGRATAEALAGEGARVMVSSRNEASLEEVGSSLRATGATVATVAADINDADTPGRLVAATVESFGTLDIVIANAGRTAGGTGPRPGRRPSHRGTQRQPDVGDPLDPPGRPGDAPASMGAHLLHHLVLGGATDPDSGPVQYGPRRVVGMGQDGRPGSGR